MGTVFTHLSLPVDSPDPSVIMANYDRRTATGQAGDRFNRPGVDRYGRAMSLGRWESDRSIEDRYGRGYEGDPLAISDFFRYGRERYSRAYDKVEPYRRTAQHRSQSLARLDSRSYGDDRTSYQSRFEEERFPRDFVMDERYARDYPEDRYTGRFFYPARSQYFDDREAFYPAERVMFEARPVFDRYGYDRFVYERPAGDRMFGERFYGPEVERFYRGSERFDAERHQEQSRHRDNQRAGAERFEAEHRQRDSQRAGGERFDAEHRHRDTQRAAGAERFETEHRDRYAKENQRFDTSEGKDQRYGKDNRYNRQMRRQDDERKRNSRYRVENSSPDRDQQRERKYSSEREQQRKFYNERERRERKFSTERDQEHHEGKFSEERDSERRLSGERRMSGEREQNYSGDRERPTVDCTERFRKM